MKQTLTTFALLCATAFLISSCGSEDKPDAPAKSYKVGDLYNVNGIKGIVYVLNDTKGEHGLVVSLDQTITTWSSEAVSEVTTLANNESDGAANMVKIAALADWHANYPAFAWCADKNVNGAQGWVLPAYDQLRVLYNVWNADQDGFNKALVSSGGVAILAPSDAEGYFWTSTETNSAFADAYMFSRGVADSPLKIESHKVRAICPF